MSPEALSPSEDLPDLLHMAPDKTGHHVQYNMHFSILRPQQVPALATLLKAYMGVVHTPGFFGSYTVLPGKNPSRNRLHGYGSSGHEKVCSRINVTVPLLLPGHQTGFSSTTMSKLSKDENVSMDVIEKICTVLNCDVGDIMEFVPDKKEEQ